MGGLKHRCRLGEGCGVQSLSRLPTLAGDSCTESRPAPAAVEGRQCLLMPGSTSGCRIMPSSGLAEANGSYGLYSFCGLTRAGWEERWWKSGIS